MAIGYKLAGEPPQGVPRVLGAFLSGVLTSTPTPLQISFQKIDPCLKAMEQVCLTALSWLTRRLPTGAMVGVSFIRPLKGISITERNFYNF